MEKTLEQMITDLDMFDVKVDYALQTYVAEVAKEAISNAALGMYVYPAYSPQPTFKASRRWASGGGIGDINVMETDVSHMELKITNKAQLQDLWPVGAPSGWAADVATIVEEGSKQFNQPFPRPFMEEGIQDAMDVGIIDKALQDGMKDVGIDFD